MNRPTLQSLLRSNLAASILRTAMQALFLAVAPMWFNERDAAAVFLLASISALATPTSALGSPILLIKRLAGHPVSAEAWQRPYGAGVLILFLASLAAHWLYGSQSLMLGLGSLFLYLLANYLRVMGDAYSQGRGLYRISQWGYVLFWVSKIAVIRCVWNTGRPLTLSGYVILEVALSLPWLLVVVLAMVRDPAQVGFRFDWRPSGAILLAGGTRTIWLEADRLFLPLVLAPERYVQYSLVSRALSGGLTLIDAQLAQLTPKLAVSTEGELRGLISAGRGQSALAALLYAGAVCGIFVLYPGMLERYWLLGLVGLLAVHQYFPTVARLDRIFYAVSARSRAALNSVGAVCVGIGILLSAYTSASIWTMVGVAGSLPVVGRLAAKFERSTC